MSSPRRSPRLAQTPTPGLTAPHSPPGLQHRVTRRSPPPSASPNQFRIRDLPLELQDHIWAEVWPPEAMLQIHPGSLSGSVVPDPFTGPQLCRVVAGTTRFDFSLVTQATDQPNGSVWQWETDLGRAARVCTASRTQWTDRPGGRRITQDAEDILHGTIFAATRAIARSIRLAVLQAARLAKIPIMLTCPGVPIITQLTQWQRAIARNAPAVIFRHGPFNVPISGLLRDFPSVRTLVMPSQNVLLNTPDYVHWWGKPIAHGIQGSQDRAHQVLVDALQNFIPDLHQPEVGAPSIRWVAEVFIQNVAEYPPPDEQPYCAPAGTLRCLIAKEVSTQVEDIFVMGAEWIREWQTQPEKVQPTQFHALIKLSDRYRHLEAAYMANHPLADKTSVRRLISSTFLGDSSAINTQGALQFDNWYRSCPDLPAISDLRARDKTDEGGYWVQRLSDWKEEGE